MKTQASDQVLTDLDDVLNKTPEWAAVTRPLPRALIAGAAAEIRRLRALLAVRSSQLQQEVARE